MNSNKSTVEMNQDTDYCLDFSDIIGDSEAQATLEDSIDTTSEADYDDHVEMLRLGLACNCKPEIIPSEFCVMDGFTLYKGCKEEIQLPPKHNHVVSLLRLDYDDVMSSWCDDRSLWTDGKRPQTVPEYFAGPTSMVTSQNDLGLVPELEVGSNSSSDIIEGRGARVMRYREKKRSRLLSKTIRYEVRKANAESRPRMKGRFVKRTSKSRG